jgi:hypothetical protein
VKKCIDDGKSVQEDREFSQQENGKHYKSATFAFQGKCDLFKEVEMNI